MRLTAAWQELAPYTVEGPILIHSPYSAKAGQPREGISLVEPASVQIPAQRTFNRIRHAGTVALTLSLSLSLSRSLALSLPRPCAAGCWLAYWLSSPAHPLPSSPKLMLSPDFEQEEVEGRADAKNGRAWHYSSFSPGVRVPRAWCLPPRLPRLPISS